MRTHPFIVGWNQFILFKPTTDCKLFGTIFEFGECVGAQGERDVGFVEHDVCFGLVPDRDDAHFVLGAHAELHSVHVGGGGVHDAGGDQLVAGFDFNRLVELLEALEAEVPLVGPHDGAQESPVALLVQPDLPAVGVHVRCGGLEEDGLRQALGALLRARGFLLVGGVELHVCVRFQSRTHLRILNVAQSDVAVAKEECADVGSWRPCFVINPDSRVVGQARNSKLVISVHFQW